MAKRAFYPAHGLDTNTSAKIIEIIKVNACFKLILKNKINFFWSINILSLKYVNIKYIF